MKQLISFVLLTFLLMQSLSVPAQDTKTTTDSLAVAHAIDNFVDAFTHLDWPRFTACFSDDATAFFPPSAKYAYRANNKAAIEELFKKVFANAHQQKSAPPYLIIEPQDVKIQLLGTIAIVTFILKDPDLLGRRTLVLKKENDKWLIVHLHASGVKADN